METKQRIDRCSVCGISFEDTGKKQQCRDCGMFANLCCEPQMPVEDCPVSHISLSQHGEGRAAAPREGSLTIS